MNDWAFSRTSARERGLVGVCVRAGAEYTPRTRSSTQSTVLGASSGVTVPSSSPTTRLRKNATAARGRPSDPEIPTAVRPVICASSRPSRCFGTRTTSDSYGWSARKITGWEVS